MEIIVTKKFYFNSDAWYSNHHAEIFDALEHNDVFILNPTDKNKEKLSDEEIKTLTDELLIIPKEYAEVLDGLSKTIFKVTFNDGGWHSGDLPSEIVVARTKHEAINFARNKRGRFKNWDVWASPFTIDGYDIVAIPKKESEST